MTANSCLMFFFKFFDCWCFLNFLCTIPFVFTAFSMYYGVSIVRMGRGRVVYLGYGAGTGYISRVWGRDGLYITGMGQGWVWKWWGWAEIGFLHLSPCSSRSQNQLGPLQYSNTHGHPEWPIVMAMSPHTGGWCAGIWLDLVQTVVQTVRYFQLRLMRWLHKTSTWHHTGLPVVLMCFQRAAIVP